MSALPAKIALTGNLPDPIQPTLQRFISRDPIGLSGGANLYRYADNSPAVSVDPTGEVSLIGSVSGHFSSDGSLLLKLTTDWLTAFPATYFFDPSFGLHCYCVKSCKIGRRIFFSNYVGGKPGGNRLFPGRLVLGIGGKEHWIEIPAQRVEDCDSVVCRSVITATNQQGILQTDVLNVTIERRLKPPGGPGLPPPVPSPDPIDPLPGPWPTLPFSLLKNG